MTTTNKTGKIKAEAASRVARMTDSERADAKRWIETDGEAGRSIGELQGFVEAPVRDEMRRLLAK
jgi:hypothetical protein